MGTYYQVFAEAKIDGVWKGIDFYVFSNGKYTPVEIIEGKSYVGSALRDKGVDGILLAKDLSEELKRDHTWYIEQENESWQGSMVRYIEGKYIADLKLPDRCGFVDKTLIQAFEEQETDEIDEYLSAKEYAALPADVRIGYEWYHWPDGTEEVWRTIRDGLQARINAYNNARYSYEYDKMPPEISMADTRVIIFMS